MSSYLATNQGIKLMDECCEIVVKGPIDSVSLYHNDHYVCLISLLSGGHLAFQTKSLECKGNVAELRLYLKS